MVGFKSGRTAVRVALVATVAVAALSMAACGKKGAATPTGVNASAVASAPSMPTTHFVNSRATAVSPTLAEHYVDFSLDYPATGWTSDPGIGSPTASNFFKVARKDPGGTDIENFAVGYFSGTGSAQGDAQVVPQLMDQLGGQFSQNFPNYHEIDRGTYQWGGVPVPQMRFSASTTIDGKPLNLFGRMLLISPKPGSQNGALILMLATDVNGEVRTIDDVGVKGQLPVLLNSFRLG